MWKQTGEIIIDHRASPGLPEDIARAAGYDPALCREGKIYEQATMTCCECKNVVVKNPNRTRPRATCSCGKYLCDICAFRIHTFTKVHKPFNKYIDEGLKAASRTATPLITGAYRDGSPTQLLLGDK